MKHFHLLSVFALLCVFIRGSNAILPAELYWESMLPNTPLPNALQELLEPAEAAGNRSSFSESELQAGTQSGQKATYGVGIMNTNVYMIPLVGADGSKAKALIVCHLDTSAWNPKHFAFQVLNVKPGGPPVCHFLNSDTIVWVPN
ncbi:hypothetical protein JCGZ_06578 [Jatropha curcas]|uniref:BURP domain-containing protein n=1 Tax=Jatropha curcas TaxID=180498 RepID=A0A067LCD0_JATCU|nr:hypothetical protein JCGZ_06578 [Jatropha curcas]